MTQRSIRFSAIGALLPAMLLIAPGCLLHAQERTGPRPSDPYLQNEHSARPAVDGLPGGLVQGARLYAAKCATCHTLSRSLRQSDLSSTEWEDIVYRMRNRASSRMTDEQAKAIVSYLAWNGQHGKK